MSPMLDARMAVRALKTRFVDHQPFILSHLITTRCNADCVTCLWKEPEDARTDELSLDEVRSLYRDAGAAGFAALVLWGGEPLLRPDVGPMLRAAQEARMRTTVITNGWLLEERAADIGPYTDRLMVSIDTIGDGHDESRRLKGLFARLDRGVRRIREDHPKVFVILNVVLSRLNLGRLEEIAEYGKDTADLISFQAMNENEYGHVERPIDGDALRLTLEEERDIAKLLVDLRGRGHPLGVSQAYLNMIETGDWSFRCHFKKVCLRVEANGDVLDCTERGRALANVRETPLAEIARSEDYRAFTRRAESCCQCRDFGVVELSHLWGGRPGSLWNAVKILV
jgi:MoaA/NifB/PqqE/SkfB family radical SAM enzyme